jgi:hypothetical protein
METKKCKELEKRVRKLKTDRNTWKYFYQNKVTEFYNVLKSIKKDFFPKSKEIQEFLKIVRIELKQGGK